MTQQQYANPPPQPLREPARGEERPVGEIVGELWESTEKLVRQELELALAEIDRKVDRIKTDVVMAAVGGSVMYAGVLSVVAAVVLLLSKAVDPWLAAMIVGVVVSGIGFALIQRGKKDLASADLKPELTIRSVERTANTFKEAVK
ncbi:MAG TPA: phage holin family protein [Polyangiaceae bacterium]